MLVCEQAEAQARDQADAPVDHRHERRLAPGRDRHRRRADQGALRTPGDRHRRDRGRQRQGLGPVDLRASTSALRCSRPRTAGCWLPAAVTRWRPGLTLPPGGLEPFRDFINERLAADVEQARGDQAMLLDALLAPGGVAGELCDALDAAGPYGAGWPSPRVAAGPVRLIKTGIVGDGHVRGIGCGDDGKSFKWIAFRSAGDGARPGAARRRAATRAGGSPARSSATSGTAATQPRCISRTPRLLDARAAASPNRHPP